MVTLTTRHLKKGDKIHLTGLGILQVRKRAARMERNPATGEAIRIRASKGCQGTQGFGIGPPCQADRRGTDHW
jgi:nucleoid DNA-binding protein